MRIILGGDVVPTDTTVPAFARGDTAALFGSALELLQTGDKVIINLECALTAADTPIRKCGPNLRGEPAYAHVLRAAGVTDVALANNHVFDFGMAGYRDTLAALTAAGLPYGGVGENEKEARRAHLIRIRDKVIALISVAEHEYSYALPDQAGVWGFDPFETMEDIAVARDQSDYVIVMYHGGKEQSRYPSPRLRKACQAMVRAGANLILCQHSHCIGAREAYRNSEILYGQGNFNFVKYIDHPHWMEGLLVQLDLDEKMKARVTYHPVVVTDEGVTLAAGEKRKQVLDELAERSLLLLDEKAWLQQWHDFCLGLADSYRMAIARAFPDPDNPVPEQRFPHYLDCEAHLDVWHELYPTWHRDQTDDTYSRSVE